MEAAAKPQIVVVEYPNIVDYRCDVLVLKYAQGFYGADAAVAGVLRREPGKTPNIDPAPGESVLLDTHGKLAAGSALFVGVVPLSAFGYKEIRDFAQRALHILHEQRSEAEHIAMTIHGVGYGLDERESFLAQVGGLVQALDEGAAPSALRKIAIVEKKPGRFERLRGFLEEVAPAKPAPEQLGTSYSLSPAQVLPRSIDAGVTSASKEHVFVAMPYDDAMEDVFVLGIQEKVNQAGYLCERLDMTSFLGDILERIKARIETASLVVADLSGGNANVYLEVGYAWGKGRRTLLLAKKGEELKFDLRNQRCIQYKNIVDLRRQLEGALADLRRSTN
jgi:hypothetical protein